MPLAAPRLFQPIKVGNMSLAHRVVLAPVTRLRADHAHVHTDLGVEYYAQRASTAGTLLISEATMISAQAAGLRQAPGIWNEQQIAAWRNITTTVHARGSFIYCQLWAPGRAADPDVLKEEGDFPLISPSGVGLKCFKERPRPLTEGEIQEYILMYTTAAQNAIEAGFDGVEIHGANGYLIDQFLQDITNKRTDKWGGSIENRCRFALEVLREIVETIGASRTAIRISPWNESLEMRMAEPLPTFEFLLCEMVKRFPDLAYLHIIGPRVIGNDDRENWVGMTEQPLRSLWAPRPFINSGGYQREEAIETADAHENELVSFGRLFIANPDLPERLRKNIPLNRYERATFFTHEKAGYTDYPFAGSGDALVS